MTLQQAVFAGLVHPGNIDIVREVVLPAAGLLTGHHRHRAVLGTPSRFPLHHRRQPRWQRHDQ